MRHLLIRHPESQHFSVTNIEVEVSRPSASSLLLLYLVTGKLSDMKIPPLGPTVRGDKLWQHTCFEAFIRAYSGTDYYEFNFAPSREWAAYRFSGYRSGMSVATEIDPPSIEVESNTDCLKVRVSLRLRQLAGLTHKMSWRLGLSALIEDLSGGKSYWALAHPPGRPDFHHMDAFAHECAPP